MSILIGKYAVNFSKSRGEVFYAGRVLEFISHSTFVFEEMDPVSDMTTGVLTIRDLDYDDTTYFFTTVEEVKACITKIQVVKQADEQKTKFLLTDLLPKEPQLPA